MLYAVLKTLHVLSIVVWVGGMVFTLAFLRPALGVLDPPLRLRLMQDVLGRFLGAVLAVSLLALLTGGWMMLDVGARVAQSGAPAATMPWTWTLMATLGLLMILIFGHIRFVLYQRLRRAVASSAWAAGGAALASIRVWVRANLALGLLIIGVVYLGGR